MTLPTNTPSPDTATSAKLAPIKTAHGFFESAAIVIAASCVLSPISARKITPKVVSSIRKSIWSSPHSLQIRHENRIAHQSAARARELFPIVRPRKPGEQHVVKKRNLL